MITMHLPLAFEILMHKTFLELFKAGHFVMWPMITL